MTLRFAKMNGAGNDFVVIDNRDQQTTLDRETIARLCDRHRGIGSDGLMAVELAVNGADFRMRYYNADGGEAEMCGNGARCFARFAGRLADRSQMVRFETMAGVITAELLGEEVRLQMSQPLDRQPETKLMVGDKPQSVCFINTGVPHAVVFVSNVEQVDMRASGSALRYHPHFAPKGTNANFVQRQPDGTLAIRTYERGVEDETLACGTGVVAAALMGHEKFGLPSPVQVKVRGGDVLEVGFDKVGDEYQNVTLTGPADLVFEGEIRLS